MMLGNRRIAYRHRLIHPVLMGRRHLDFQKRLYHQQLLLEDQTQTDYLGFQVRYHLIHHHHLYQQ
jgi:hypothetical protein